MASILVFLPFIYLFLGCTYGVAAVIRRIYLRSEFTQLPAEERDTLASEAPSGLTPLQGMSALTSSLFLAAGLYATLPLLLTGDMDNAGMGALLTLVVITPFLVGFQARGVWSRAASYSEDAQLSTGSVAPRLYYAVLIATWALGIGASYIVSFTALTRMG